MGRENHGQAFGRSCLHQLLQELTARDWIEAGQGLVEQQQFRSLAERERERQLGALWPIDNSSIRWRRGIANRCRRPSAIV